MKSRPFIAALAVLAMAGSACLTRTESFTEVGVAEPAPPVMVDPPMPGGPDTDGGGESGEVTFRDDIERPTAVPYERTSYVKDGSQLTVSWISGVEPCTSTAGIDVQYGEESITVTVLEGAPPEAATMSCIMMAVEKHATITLDEDLAGRRIVDGAR